MIYGELEFSKYMPMPVEIAHNIMSNNWLHMHGYPMRRNVQHAKYAKHIMKRKQF